MSGPALIRNQNWASCWTIDLQAIGKEEALIGHVRYRAIASITEIFGPEMVGLEFAPITVEIAGDLSSWRAEVPGRVRAAANALSGPTSQGKPPRMENLPGAEGLKGHVPNTLKCPSP